MKICPTCRKTYQDDGLNFCLDDGSVLTIAAQEAPPTMVMHNPPPTSPNPVFSQPNTQQTWAQQPSYSMQPKKKSKAWIWVTGLLALGVLLCGGGGIGMLVFFASQSEKQKAGNPNPPPPPSNTRTNSGTTNTSPGGERTNLSTVD